MPPIYQRSPILPVVQSAASVEPLPLGTNPLPPSPKSKVAKDAAKLWGEAETLTGRLRKLQREAAELGAQLESARDALAAEVERGAVSGDRNPAQEAELVAALQAAEIAADPGILQRRYRALLDAQRVAVQKAQRFLSLNIADLIKSEYQALAEEAWAALESAEAGDSRAALEGARVAYEDMRRKVLALEPWAFDKRAFVVPSTGLPLPPAESYTRPEAPRVPVAPPTFDPQAVKVAQVVPQLARAG